MTTHLEVIAYLVAAYPGAEFPLPSQKLYIQELKHIPAEELMEAARYHIHTSPYPKVPMIGELENALLHIRRRRAKLPDPFEAWGEVVRVMGMGVRHEHHYCEVGLQLRDIAITSSKDPTATRLYLDALHEIDMHEKACETCGVREIRPQYSHPLIAEAVKALEMTRVDGDNEGVQRAHFTKAYEQLIRRAADQLLPMIGVSDERRLLENNAEIQ